MKTCRQTMIAVLAILLSFNLNSAFAQEVSDTNQAKVIIKKNIEGEETLIERDFEFDGEMNIEELIREISEETGLDINADDLNLNLDIDIEEVMEGEGLRIMKIQSESEQARKKSSCDKASKSTCLKSSRCGSASKKPFLGVTIAPNSDVKGALIEAVSSGSAAQKAGLQAGDVLTKINKDKIIGYGSLTDVLASYKIDDEIKVKFLRNGKKNKASATLAARPAFKKGRSCGSARSAAPKCSDRSNFKGHSTIQNKAMLGVLIEDAPNEAGAIVTKVYENSAAAETGIELGDLIVRVGDKPVSGKMSLISSLSNFNIGDSAEIELLRNEKAQTLNATLKGRTPNKSCEEKMIIKSFEDFNFDTSELEEKLKSIFGEEGANININIEGTDIDDMSQKIQDALKNSGIDLNEDVDMDIVIVGKREIKIADMPKEEVEQMNQKGLLIPITDEPSISDLNFYPNPNNGKFNLSFSSKDPDQTEIRIFDLSGRNVLSTNLGSFSGEYKNEIDISEENPGTYVLQIIKGNKVLNKKIIVQ